MKADREDEPYARLQRRELPSESAAHDLSRNEVTKKKQTPMIEDSTGLDGEPE